MGRSAMLGYVLVSFCSVSGESYLQHKQQCQFSCRCTTLLLWAWQRSNAW